MSIKINGKELALEIEEEIKSSLNKLDKKSLEIIMVGNLFSSQKYVENKKRVTERVGGICNINHFEEDVSEQELEDFINNKNADKSVGGIIIQHPIPKHLDERKLNDLISIEKDVDALSSKALEMLENNSEICLPATVKGIMTILERYNIPIKDNKFIVMGKSRILGYPLYLKLKNLGANVFLADSKTQNIQDRISENNVVIVGIGRPRYIQADWIDGQIIIDAGYNEGNVGDVDESAYLKSSMYTPVPGGVGPMTIAMLMENTYRLYKQQKA